MTKEWLSECRLFGWRKNRVTNMPVRPGFPKFRGTIVKCVHLLGKVEAYFSMRVLGINLWNFRRRSGESWWRPFAQWMVSSVIVTICHYTNQSTEGNPLRETLKTTEYTLLWEEHMHPQSSCKDGLCQEKLENWWGDRRISHRADVKDMTGI